MNFQNRNFINNQTKTDSDQIEQYFGSGNIFEQENFAGGSRKKENEFKSFFINSFCDKINRFPIKYNAGFLLFFILCIITFVWSLIFIKVMNMFTTMILGVFSYYCWKNINFDTIDEIDYYLSNATITLRALLEHTPLIKNMMEYSKMILMTGVLIGSVNSLILSWFFPSEIYSIFFAISFFILLIGLVISFSKKEYKYTYQILTLHATFLLICFLIKAFFLQYVSFFIGCSFAFFWFIASVFNKWTETINTM